MFKELGGKEITGGFKNNDVADEPTIALRIREKLARMRAAAAEAPAPAPAQELSPFRNQKREPKQVDARSAEKNGLFSYHNFAQSGRIRTNRKSFSSSYAGSSG